MKLLLINYEFPPVGGGAGRATSFIAKYLVKLGHEVTVMTSKYNSLPHQEIKYGYTLLRIPGIRRREEKSNIFEVFIFLISSMWQVLKLKWKPDASIAFFTIPSAPAAYLLKLFKKVPYIVSLRGGDVPGFLPKQLGVYHFLLKPLIYFLWKKANATVANSHGLKEIAEQTRSPIEVIPNGVDCGIFFRSGLKHPSIPLPILTVGRLCVQKRISDVIAAFAEAKKKSSVPLILWIAGDGPQRKLLEKQVANLGLSDSVIFWGWMSPEHLREMYEKAAIFTLVSSYEGMPNVMLEAMAMGLPIIGTKVQGVSELVVEGKNGFLIPVGDIQVLTQKILELAGNADLREKMGIASLERAEIYNWEQVALEYLKLLSGHPAT